MELYDKIGVQLNEVFCYFWYVGRWKELSPLDLLDRKRKLDTTVHTYRPFFSESFFSQYRNFIREAFAEYAVRGEDAKLRTTLENRSDRFQGNWDNKWETMFTDEDNSGRVKAAYEGLLSQLASELDLSSTKR